MTRIPLPSPRARVWIAATVLAAALGAAAVAQREKARAARRLAPVAAYLVPVAEGSRVKLSPWRSQPLTAPVPVRSGTTVTLPAGSRALLIHTADGKSTALVGPATATPNQALPHTPRPLLSPLSEVLPELEKTFANAASTPAITSPVGVTRYLNPPITWTARDGVLYDIAVLDPADPLLPPRIARGVRPPVPLARLETPLRRQLTPDRIYEIYLGEAGAENLAAAARVLAAADATPDAATPDAPADALAEATAAMAQKPARTGDAWLALETLPPAWAATEPVVRLRLLVAAELGHADAFARAKADAARLPKP